MERVGLFENDCNNAYLNRELYEVGRRHGRRITEIQAKAELVLGMQIMGAAINSLGGTGSFGAVCTVATEGGCAVPIATVMVGEFVVAVGGGSIAIHGDALMAYTSSDGGLLGANGPQINSQTLWQGKEGRIDLENPNPGQRAGQIHFQPWNNKKIKFLYDIEAGKFLPDAKTGTPVPNWLKNLQNSPDVQNAIQKGARILGGE